MRPAVPSFTRSQPTPQTKVASTPATTIGGFDQKATARLQEIKKALSRFREIKLLSEAEVGRRQEELVAAKQAAMEAFGTSDIDELRELVISTQNEVTADLETLEAQITELNHALDEIGEGL
jgi:hypothetical protein